MGIASFIQGQGDGAMTLLPTQGNDRFAKAQLSRILIKINGFTLSGPAYSRLLIMPYEAATQFNQ